MKKSHLVPVALALGFATLAAACGDDGGSSSGSAAATTTAAAASSAAAAGSTASTGSTGASTDPAARKGKTAAELYKTDLTKDCPKTITVQKDWLAEVEHASVYQLIGDKGKMSESTYEGPLGSTGVNMKIIDGGPGMVKARPPSPRSSPATSSSTSLRTSRSSAPTTQRSSPASSRSWRSWHRSTRARRCSSGIPRPTPTASSRSRI